MILDNATTAMTGGQISLPPGRLEDICLGLGVEKDHIHIVNPSPKYHEENMQIIKEEINYTRCFCDHSRAGSASRRLPGGSGMRKSKETGRSQRVRMI